MSIRESRRFGKFSITEDLLDVADEKMLLKFMSNFIMMRAERMYCNGEIEYEAWSPLFAVVKQGEMVPYYTVTCEQIKTKNEDGTFLVELGPVQVEKRKEKNY